MFLKVINLDELLNDVQDVTMQLVLLLFAQLIVVLIFVQLVLFRDFCGRIRVIVGCSRAFGHLAPSVRLFIYRPLFFLSSNSCKHILQIAEAVPPLLRLCLLLH